MYSLLQSHISFHLCSKNFSIESLFPSFQASNLQLAWEILEMAAKIFSSQGERGLANLAEVQTELANIEFENNILESARDDYGKFKKIFA